MAVAGKINTSNKKCVFANRILTAIVNSGNSLLQVKENTLEYLLMMLQALNRRFYLAKKLKELSSKPINLKDHAPLQMNTNTANMSKSDTIMENAMVQGGFHWRGMLQHTGPSHLAWPVQYLMFHS